MVACAVCKLIIGSDQLYVVQDESQERKCCSRACANYLMTEMYRRDLIRRVTDATEDELKRLYRMDVLRNSDLPPLYSLSGAKIIHLDLKRKK